MRIDTSEDSLIKLFNKGQVGCINLEFRRLFDVIECLALQKAELDAENKRLRKAGDAMWNTAQQDGTGLWLHKSFEDWHKMNHPRTKRGVK